MAKVAVLHVARQNVEEQIPILHEKPILTEPIEDEVSGRSEIIDRIS